MVDSGARVWWGDVITSSFNSNYYDPSDGDPNGLVWVNVKPFANYINGGGYQIEGPYGWINEASLAYADVGDTIQIRDSTSGDGWYHTYVVTSVDGTAGSRTPANIWVSAHTRNALNEQLSTINNNVNYYRNIRISGHYRLNP